MFPFLNLQIVDILRNLVWQLVEKKFYKLLSGSVQPMASFY